MFPTTCIDKFYNNPLSVVNLASSLEYFDTHGSYPGKRTKPLHLVSEEFFNVFTEKLFSVFFDYEKYRVDYKVITCFQKIIPFTNKKDDILNSGWIHRDNGIVGAGVIYLNENSFTKSGTSFYTLNNSNDISIDIDWSLRNNFYLGKNEDIEKYKSEKIKYESLFEKNLEVGNVFNRLVLYDSNIWHKESSFWNEDNVPRITQVFFIMDLKTNQKFPLDKIKLFDL